MFKKVIAGFVLFFGAVMAVFALSEIEEPSKEGLACSDDKIAWRAPVRAEAYAKDGLVSPTTAKFGEQQTNLTSSEDDNICNYIVTGLVDAQNSFGAMLRTQYSVSVRYDKQADRWSLIDLSIEN